MLADTRKVMEVASRLALGNGYLSSTDEEILARWRTVVADAQSQSTVSRDILACNCGSSCDTQDGIAGFSIWIELTEDCNLDCVFCYNPWRPLSSELRRRPQLSYEVLTEGLERILTALPVRHVILSGGEPLMYRHFWDLLQFLGGRCERIGITTNGKSATLHRLARASMYGLKEMSVPLHSLRAEAHDELAGGRSWTSAVRAIIYGIGNGISTTVSSVVTSKNYRDIAGVARLTACIGARSMVLNCFHQTGQGVQRGDLSVSDEIFDSVSASASQVSDDLVVVTGSPPKRMNGSRSVADRVTISPYGDLKLCNQSSAGLVNLSSEADLVDNFLSALRDMGESLERFLGEIDSCTCFVRV